MLSDENYAKEVAALNHFIATILALAEKPDFRRDGRTDGEAAETPIKETTLARFVFPPAGAMLEATRRNDALLRATHCLVALRRWQLEHAEPPTDLAAVAKAAGMPAVPLDPYSDAPLRMATVAGKPVIYSVGSDGKDDNAQFEWNMYSGHTGDIIFRLESLSQ
jgi:hypothetical protein